MDDAGQCPAIPSRDDTEPSSMARGASGAAAPPRAGASARRRIFAACLLVTLASMATLTGTGIGFCRVLHHRARESCVRIADLFASFAVCRLKATIEEAGALADAAAKASDSAEPPAPPSGSLAAACSWALYGPDGRRVAGAYTRGHPLVLERLGIGSQQLPQRDRLRLDAALHGRSSVFAVGDGVGAYAIHYRAVGGPAAEPRVLQVATDLSDPMFAQLSAGGARAVVRPLLGRAEEPRTVTLDGKLHLVVQRPLIYDRQQMGIVTAAIPFAEEARLEQAFIFFILVLAITCTLLLALISYLLRDVAGEQALAHDGSAEDYRGEPGAPLPRPRQGVRPSGCHELPLEALDALVQSVGARDPALAEHSRRVALLACAVAKELGWDRAATEELRLAGLLHDVGLHEMPDAAAPEERDADSHPVEGARILSPLPDCIGIVRAVLHHHERFDGTGYPAKLKGHGIPIAARVLALAEFHDERTPGRAATGGLPEPDAIDALWRRSGSWFDPDLVEIFVELLLRGPLTDEQPPSPTTGESAAHGGAADERLRGHVLALDGHFLLSGHERPTGPGRD